MLIQKLENTFLIIRAFYITNCVKFPTDIQRMLQRSEIFKCNFNVKLSYLYDILCIGTY